MVPVKPHCTLLQSKRGWCSVEQSRAETVLPSSAAGGFHQPPQPGPQYLFLMQGGGHSWPGYGWTLEQQQQTQSYFQALLRPLSSGLPLSLGLKAFPSRAAPLAMCASGHTWSEGLPTSLAGNALLGVVISLVGVGILPASALLPMN